MCFYSAFLFLNNTLKEETEEEIIDFEIYLSII